MESKKIRKITAEAEEIKNHIYQLINGDLEPLFRSDSYDFLGEVAYNLSLISETFSIYINEIAHVLTHLSAGNLAVPFKDDINYQGDFLPIKNALHKIKHSLNKSFEEIDILTQKADALSSQVEGGASLIAKNASDQAELINELTDTVHKITEQTSINALNAQAVSDNISTIRNETIAGSGYMTQMLVSIEKVKVSSKDIANVITIIKEIAEQTKLLALNASIEAARAGNTGNGFSVVAREVGNLAQRCSEAVKETTQLVESNISTSENSYNIVNRAAESFKKISSLINKVSGLGIDISDASKQQAEDLSNISSIIKGFSEAMQVNAAYAQENYSVTTNLTQISSQLKKVMSGYHLRNREQAGNYDQNIESGKVSNLKLSIVELLQKAIGIDEIDKILESVIMQYKELECLYVIDGKGYQLSHTVMNPGVQSEMVESFKPALPGDYHGTKKYFRQAVKVMNEWYISDEYISTATGGLCKTFSCSYKGNDNNTYVICFDLICSH
jgi:methyl-accepting chemotaxis protein